MKKIGGVTLCILFGFLLTACGKNVGAKRVDLTEGIAPTPMYEKKRDTSKEKEAYLNFSMKLFEESLETGKNTLISPLSVLSALGMTANGAKGKTLSEMEALFGLSKEELNAFMSFFSKKGGRKGEGILEATNSIWINEKSSFSPKKDFLNKNVSVYDAEIFQSKFDGKTAEEINSWVEENTKGRIKDVLDSVPSEALIYLVNALTFDAKWNEVYMDYQISDREFTTYTGKKNTVSMMFADEFGYLEDEKAKGFIKPYKDYRYGFACLLPNEGEDVYEYAKEINGEKLKAIFDKKEDVKVITGLPAFRVEYGLEMSDALKNLGMKAAFHEDLAEFQDMGEAKRNLFIGRVLHKTFLEVDRNGTKAAAATVVETLETSENPEKEPKKVILDRPFLYMIVDMKDKLPIFIGVAAEVGEERRYVHLSMM